MHAHTPFRLSGSIIAADYAHLAQAITHMNQAQVDYLHFDIMDHHYVPNLTLGPCVLKQLKPHCPMPIDAHLMVSNPDDYIDALADAGARYVTVHPETCPKLEATLQRIRDQGMLAGVAFNPDQDACEAASYLDNIDMILQMTVFPGFSGQSFRPDCLPRIQACRSMLDEHNKQHVVLAVDGGIKADNIHLAAQAGARFFVMGSGLFNATDMRARVQSVHQALAQV